MKSRHLWLWLVAVLALAGASQIIAYVPQPRSLCQDAMLTITSPNQTKIVAEIVDTPDKRERGLSQRTSLDSNHGMLFLFPITDIYPFWMKDTLIPLDIIWLKDHKVVEIASLQPPDSTTIPQYVPKQSADAVLEINQGLAEQFQIQLGSELAWPTCNQP